MANSDIPSGARPWGKVLRASQYLTGGIVYPGDFVTMGSAGTVAAAGASTALCGVALGYAASGANVLVADHPDQRFWVQVDGSQPANQTELGLNYNITATGGSTLFKASRMELDSDTVDTTATLPLKMLQLAPDSGNDFGANAKVVVIINNHQHKGSTGTAGV